MEREVTGAGGIRWTCVQAYAGLAGGEGEGGAADELKDEAAGVGGGRVRVVCTPSGGAKSVGLELRADWESTLGDEELLREIEARREA